VTVALLDTHTFVWAVADPDRLGPVARRLLVDPSVELMVSAVSAWELATKVRLGKFASAEPIVAQYEFLVARLGARQLDVSTTHALHAGALRWDHRDPFDRVLAAQAMLEHATLVSTDGAFRELPGLTTLW
jgi:PIN domain nuclease of toxin-antitoxin system